MKIGVFGGSFDPVHLGHLILAEFCREQANLEKVVFVPAAISPFKPEGPIASDSQRVEMLELAIGGHPDFDISQCEIERGGASYTVDTLQQLGDRFLEKDLYLIMGADSADDFQEWKEPSSVCQLSTPLIVARRGSTSTIENLRPFVDEPRFREIQQRQVEFPWIEISSTEIRQAVKEKKSIRYRVPRAVEKYIQAKKLYDDT